MSANTVRLYFPIFPSASSKANICAAIQLSKLSGFSPIITTASRHNEALLKSLGATHVIDRSVPLSDLGATVKALTDKPLKVAYDTISSADTQNAVYDTIAPGGRVIVVVPIAVDEVKIRDDKDIQQIQTSPYAPQHRELSKSLYAVLTGLFEAGEIKVCSSGHAVQR